MLLITTNEQLTTHLVLAHSLFEFNPSHATQILINMVINSVLLGKSIYVAFCVCFSTTEHDLLASLYPLSVVCWCFCCVFSQTQCNHAEVAHRLITATSNRSLTVNNNQCHNCGDQSAGIYCYQVSAATRPVWHSICLLIVAHL